MIPLPTTTITVERPSTSTVDAWDTQTWEDVAVNVPAHIGSPDGVENRDGGRRTDTSARLHCNPIELKPYDRVTDQTTGIQWSVQWAEQRGPFLTHTVGGLARFEGVARG